MFTTDYLIICAFLLCAVIYIIVKVIHEETETDEGDGGIRYDDVPIPDVPNGSVSIDEYEEEGTLIRG